LCWSVGASPEMPFGLRKLGGVCMQCELVDVYLRQAVE